MSYICKFCMNKWGTIQTKKKPLHKVEMSTSLRFSSIRTSLVILWHCHLLEILLGDWWRTMFVWLPSTLLTPTTVQIQQSSFQVPVLIFGWRSAAMLKRPYPSLLSLFPSFLLPYQGHICDWSPHYHVFWTCFMETYLIRPSHSFVTSAAWIASAFCKSFWLC